MGRITLLGLLLQLSQVNKSKQSYFSGLYSSSNKVGHNGLFCLPAGQQHASALLPGVVHRPQVQQISNNIVTLSNVQSPALYLSQPNQKEPQRPNSQTPQTGSLTAIGNSPKKGNF